MTFVLVESRNRNILLVTRSAGKARAMLKKGIRCEVWEKDHLFEKVYWRSRVLLLPYIEAEKDYHRQKQMRREDRNRRRSWTS